MQRSNNADAKSVAEKLLSRIKDLTPDATLLVLSVFVLLQIFRLVNFFITSKTAGSILVIPFQLLIFLLPAYLFARLKNPRSPIDYISRLRIKSPRVHQLPLTLSGALALISGCLLIGSLFNSNGGASEGFTLYNAFSSGTDFSFFRAIFLIIAYAVVPAVCEELVFRAILCREFEKYNVVFAIGASSVFFALLHFNLSQFPIYLFSGILLALSMYATGSVAVPMIMHMIYNVAGLFGQPFLNAFYEVTGGSSGLFLFVIFIAFMLGAALFCSFASKSYLRRASHSSMPDRPLLPSPDALINAVSNVFLTPYSIAAVCFYIVVLIIYSVI